MQEPAKVLVGRFAPSPTGDLHMGSLMAAVASYLSARAQRGRWLLRIEDVDFPRVVPGATERILHDLERFGFEWDGPVCYQSKRHDFYREALKKLLDKGLVYPCTCSRREIQVTGLIGVDGFRYSGRCRSGVCDSNQPMAWRIRVPDEDVVFIDGIQGEIKQNLANDVGDFVLLRADAYWAYQLAVVVDDAAQGVNQIVRGADLLDSTPRQIWLQNLLGNQGAEYLHIPVITNMRGEKLSKQTQAPILQPGNESDQLWQALKLLWQAPPPYLRKAGLREIWQWAISNWGVKDMPQKRGFPVEIDGNNEYRFIEMNK